MPQTDLGKPKGMGRDRDGNIIVLEPHYQRVNVFSPEGKLVAQWGKRGTNAGEFMLPRAVAVNSRGEVFVSEYSLLERVQRFAARGEKLLAGFGHSGNGPGEFNRPEGLCVDSQDRLYVADSCNHRIQVFSSDGQFLRAYGKAGKGKGELSYPYDICVDAAGRQYVCEFGNSRIQVFDANDRPLEIIGGPGAAPGQFNNPWGVALDSAGNLYVADSQNHRVQKLIRQMNFQFTHPYYLLLLAPGAGVGDLVCLEDRRAGQPLAALDRAGHSHRRADRPGVRDCRPPMAAAGGRHERVLRAGPLRQHPLAAAGGRPGIRQPHLQGEEEGGQGRRHRLRHRSQHRVVAQRRGGLAEDPGRGRHGAHRPGRRHSAGHRGVSGDRPEAPGA